MALSGASAFKRATRLLLRANSAFNAGSCSKGLLGAI